MCTRTQSMRRESSGASHRKCVTPATTGQQAGGGRERATFTFTSRQSGYFICAIKTHKQIRHHAKRSLSQCVGSSLATLSAPDSVSSWLLSRFSWKRTPFSSNCPLPPPEDQCSFGAFLLPRPVVLSLSHRSAVWKALSPSPPLPSWFLLPLTARPLLVATQSAQGP